jgi:hypothetical protein
MMWRVAELGVELVGRDDATDLPIERVKVGQVQTLRVPTQPPDPDKPNGSYRAELEDETIEAGDLPAGGANFLVGRRLELTQRSAQFTSSDGDNHLISFGEFAALYLMAWSPACWGEVVPNAHVATENDDPTTRPQLRWLDTLSEAQRIITTWSSLPGPHPRAPFSSTASEETRGDDRRGEKSGSEKAPRPAP